MTHFSFDDRVSFTVNPTCFSFGHSASFHRLACTSFCILCMCSIFDGIGSLLGLSKLVFGEFVTPRSRQLRHFRLSIV